MAAVNIETITELKDFLARRDEVSEGTARILMSMSLEPPATRDAALSLGVVPVMLPYMRAGASPELLRVLTQTFSNLCLRIDEDPAVQLVLVTPALPVIKELLRHEDEDVLESACTAIVNLTHGANMGTEAVQAVPGLTARLVALLGHEAVRVQHASLSAVSNMLAGADSQVKHCLDVGCFDHIVRLLRCSEPALVEGAVRASKNILVRPRSYGQYVQDIFVWLLIILAVGEPRCQAPAAKLIADLFHTGSAYQRARVELSELLETCSAALDSSAAAEARNGVDELSVTLIQQVFRILQCVMYELEGIEAVQAVPGLTARLVALLGHEAVAVQGAALEAVINILAGTFSHAQRCLDAGCLDHIKRLLQCSEPALVEGAVRAARNIFRHTRSHTKRALRKDILTPLQDILAHGELKCQVPAAEAIVILCNNLSVNLNSYLCSNNAAALRTHAVLQCCGVALDKVAAMEPEGLDELAVVLTENVCRIFELVMRCWSQGRRAVLAVPGLAAQLVALLGHEAIRVQQAALEVVMNMLAGNIRSHTQRCLDAGCLDHIVRLLQRSEPTLVEGAARAAGNIFRQTSSQMKRALEKDILGPLQNLFAHEELKCQVSAAEAIVNLCNNLSDAGSAAQRARVVSSGVLQRCSAALGSAAAAEAGRLDELAVTFTELVCRILQHVVRWSEGKSAVLAAPGLTARLLALLGHEAARVQEAVLVTLVTVINMLARTDPQLTICLNGCLEHIARLLQCSEPARVEQAAQAADNLFWHTHCIQRALEKNIHIMLAHVAAKGELLVGWLKCQQRAVWAIASLCWRGSAAQRDQLVASGALRAWGAALAGSDDSVLAGVLDGLNWLLQKTIEDDMNTEALRSQLRELALHTQIEILSEDGIQSIRSKADELLEKYQYWL